MAEILYASANPIKQQTDSPELVDITGLEIKLPPATPFSPFKSALVTLCLSGPFAEGKNAPAGAFAITVDGSMQAVGTFSSQQPSASGRIPTTVVTEVILGLNPIDVKGQWASIRNSMVQIDDEGTASLCAILVP